MTGITAHLPLSRLACTLALSLSFGLGSASADTENYAEREDVQAFISDLSARHGFDAGQLSRTIGQAQKLPRVISLITPPTKRGVRSWERYRSRFIERIRIERGLDFWDEYAPILQAAEERYGVPAEIIVAIIGVETVYGRHTGNFETLSALTTLAFDYPPRADLCRRELEQLFLLAREQGREPTSYSGSYAGALGYPQFLPSSMRAYAVDFDANGVIDFEDNPLDAIGSVANYLHAHGWQPQERAAANMSGRYPLRRARWRANAQKRASLEIPRRRSVRRSWPSASSCIWRTRSRVSSSRAASSSRVSISHSSMP